MEVSIRWLIRADMQDVLAVENSSFSEPWTEQEFLLCLRERNCIGLVAEHNGRVLGFVLYELCKDYLNIINIAVTPSARRENVGTRMLQRLIDKLSYQRRTRITCKVRETNLEAQLFLQASGFYAAIVLRDYYADCEGDSYEFRYSLGGNRETLARTRLNRYFSQSQFDD